jgi:hypothetical protein
VDETEAKAGDERKGATTPDGNHRDIERPVFGADCWPSTLKSTISKRQSLPFEMVLTISQRAASSNVLQTRLGLTAHMA